MVNLRPSRVSLPSAAFKASANQSSHSRRPISSTPLSPLVGLTESHLSLLLCSPSGLFHSQQRVSAAAAPSRRATKDPVYLSHFQQLPNTSRHNRGVPPGPIPCCIQSTASPGKIGSAGAADSRSPFTQLVPRCARERNCLQHQLSGPGAAGFSLQRYLPSSCASQASPFLLGEHATSRTTPAAGSSASCPLSMEARSTWAGSASPSGRAFPSPEKILPSPGAPLRRWRRRSFTSIASFFIWACATLWTCRIAFPACESKT